MRIRTILKAAAVPAIIVGGLLATSAGSAAHAATLSSTPALATGQNSISYTLSGVGVKAKRSLSKKIGIKPQN